MVGRYLPWWGVPTLVGGTYPSGGTYPGGGVPTWLGGYLPWALLMGTFQLGEGSISTFQPPPPSTRVGTTQSKVGTSGWGTYLSQGSYPPGQAKCPSLTHLSTWGPLPYSTSNHGGTSVTGLDTLVLGYPHHTHNQVYPSPPVGSHKTSTGLIMHSNELFFSIKQILIFPFSRKFFFSITTHHET